MTAAQKTEFNSYLAATAVAECLAAVVARIGGPATSTHTDDAFGTERLTALFGLADRIVMSAGPDDEEVRVVMSAGPDDEEVRVVISYGRDRLVAAWNPLAGFDGHADRALRQLRFVHRVAAQSRVFAAATKVEDDARVASFAAAQADRAARLSVLAGAR